jgi:flavin reductase (DIM6/NTAB) family NADH-FMN oxidoreductase RutF/rubredoxin
MDHKAFTKISYGLYIVATAFEGGKAGYIANTVFQVTSSPPRIAISCHKDNHTLQVLLKSGIFSVSVLKKETPTGLIGTFGYMSGKVIDKFENVQTIVKSTGAPVVTDSCVAWLDCRVEETLDLGTHMLLIGLVVDSDLISDDEPLTYDWYRIKYKLLSPKNSPTYIGSETTGTSGDNVRQPVVPVEQHAEPEDKEPYICTICGHVYYPEEGDPSLGIPPGTPFSEVPEDFRCPICNAGKDYYKPLQ